MLIITVKYIDGRVMQAIFLIFDGCIQDTKHHDSQNLLLAH